MTAEQQAPPGEPQAAPAGEAARADPVAWLIALVTFAAYTVISVSRYQRLDPGSWDLGIFTEYVRQIAHLHAPVVDIRGAGFNLLGDHFQPAVGLLAPFFRLFPTPVTLLVAQALLTAVSVVPVCRAAQASLGLGASRAIGAAYGFSWGLQQMINFDFHEIAFAVPLLACSLSALVRRRLRATVAWALPLVLVKEDQGFTLAALGLVMVGMGLAAETRAQRSAVRTAAERGTGARSRDAGSRGSGDRSGGAWAWAGALLAVWGIGWSLAEIVWIIPHFNPSHHYPYWKNGGVLTPGARPPVAAIAHQLFASGGEKLHTTLLVLLPVAFLALRSPLVLVAVPSLALRFLSTNNYFWGTGWHYNATVMPIVFLAAVDGMARIAERSAQRAGATTPVSRRNPPRPGTAVARYGGAVMAVIAAWLAFSNPLSSLWNPQTYVISPHVHAEQAAMSRVPGGTTVEATLTMLAPLAARDEVFWVGSTGDTDPRYIVFDESNSGYSPPPANVLAFVEQQHPGYAYRQVFADNAVYVFRLAGGAARTAAATGG